MIVVLLLGLLANTAGMDAQRDGIVLGRRIFYIDGPISPAGPMTNAGIPAENSFERKLDRSTKPMVELADLENVQVASLTRQGVFCHAVMLEEIWAFEFLSAEGTFFVACKFPANLQNPFEPKQAGGEFRLKGKVSRSSFTQLYGAKLFVVESPGDIQLLSPPPWSRSKSLWIVSVLSIFAALGSISFLIAHFRLKQNLTKMAMTEGELVELNRLLEERIRARTQELQVVNANLQFQISERKKADERIAIQQAELLHVSRLSTLGLMSTAISHEINQPLGAISNYSAASLHLIDTTGQDCLTEIKTHIEEISLQSLRAGQIIKRMRSFGRKTDARRSTCDLNDLVRDSVELLGVELHYRSIRVKLEVFAKPVMVIADRIQLQQLIVNLIANAADSMQLNSKDQRLVTLRTMEAHDNVVLIVEDQGPGVPNHIIDHIFEPFVSSKPDGMGIGLSICEAIAQDHGGQITVQNLELGARFTLTLPKNFLFRQESIVEKDRLVTA